MNQKEIKEMSEEQFKMYQLNKKLNNLKSRVAKDNFIRNCIKKCNIYL